MGFLDFLGPIGGIINGIGGIVGGVLGNNAARENNQIQLDIAQKNIDFQKEFAQMGVRWKADDARAAGLHPLFGMGANTPSFSPVSVNLDKPDYSFMGRAGQDILGAIAKTKGLLEKKDDLMERTMQTLQINRAGLENEMLATQIARMRQQSSPPFPMPGQSSPGGGNSGDVVVDPRLGTFESKPHEITTSNPYYPQNAAGGAVPQVRWGLSQAGSLQPFPPPGLIDDQEITNPVFLRWLISNEGRRPPESVWRKMFPDANDIRWSKTGLGWVPVKYAPRDPEHGRYERILTPFERARRGGVVTVPMPR